MKKKTFYLGLSLFFILSALIFFLPPVDTDLGWHLRCGEYFLKNLAPMRKNELTYLLPDHAWQNSYFAYQVATTLIYNLFGFLGLSLANAFFFGTLGVIIFFYTRKDLLSSLLVFLSTVAFGWGSLKFGFRAQNFTLLGITLVLYLLKRAEKNPQYLFLIPVVVAFWANFHGGFVLGLVVFAFFLITQVFLKQKKLLLPAVPAFLFSILAGAITPFGLGVHQEAWHHAFYPLKRLIAEWVPPRLSWRLAVLTITLAFSPIFFKKPKRFLFPLLLALFFGWQAIFARRNLPLFGLVLGIAWADWLGQEEFWKKFSPNLNRTLLPILFSSLAFLLLVIRVPQTLSFIKSEEAICAKGMATYPCQAIKWVKKQPLLGQNVYSAYEWGGFLEWKLPEYKPFVDGRMPAWPTPSGKSPYTIYLEIIQARPGWDKELEKYGTDWLLIQTGTFLDLELKRGDHPIWELIYQDEVASIYTKRK